MKRSIISILLISLTLILFVLGGNSCKKSKDTTNNVPENPEVGTHVYDIALSFTENDSLGNPVTLDTFSGDVILLTFSAMWCGPCRSECPELVELYNTYHQRGLQIVQCIYQDEDGNPTDLTDLARWIQEFGVPFIVFHDPDYSTVNQYLGANAGIPYNVIIDRNFIIRHIIQGFDGDSLRRYISQLL